jgi:RNA polymerase-binding transcription factor DksA
MELKSNINEVAEQLDKFKKSFVKIERDNGSTIVEDAQFTTIENKLDVSRLSDSEDAAINEASYLDVRQGESVDQNNIDETIKRFVRDYLEEVFK